MEKQTHKEINEKYSGKPIEMKDNYSKVKLTTTSEMILDETGLIHGGFIFSIADYAAMLAINKPTVVLGGANCRFIIPVKEGEELIAEAMLSRVNGKKKIVDVNVKRGGEIVFIGEFYCFTPEKHVFAENYLLG